MILALRLGLTPLLVLAVGSLERRLGRVVGGVLAGLPLTSAPVMLVLAVGQGPAFAAAAARAAEWGAVGQTLLCVLYAGTAVRAPRGRRGVGLSVAVTAAGFVVGVAVGAWALAAGRPPLLAGPVAAVVVALVALRFWPGLPPAAEVDAALHPWRRLAGRALGAEVLTLTVAALAPLVGPGPAGLLGTLPVLALTLAVGAHREAGPGAASEMLRAVVAATPAVAVFLTVLAAGLTRWGVPTAFVVAGGCAVAVAALGTAISTRSFASDGGHERVLDFCSGRPDDEDMTSTETDHLADVRGAVLRRGDAQQADELAGFQTADPHRPDVVVAARDATDVVAAVRYAAAHDLPVTVQATGHGHTAGLTRGVVVTTGAMRAVTVDPGSRTARVEAGVRSADLVAAAADHGLAPVSGSFPGVGVVGYTLGGGLGLLGREFGWASDHLRAAEIVTADGAFRRVGPGEDLFAALRGGRPDVGVVTALEIGLVPLGTVVGGGLFLDADDAARVLPAVRRLGAEAPDALSVSVGVVPVPDLDVVPAPIRGRTVLHVRLVSTDADLAYRAEAAVREVAPVLLGGLRELAWTESGSIFGEPETPHAYEGTDLLVSDLSDEALGRVVAAARSAAVGCVVDVRRLGGALARPAVGDDAVSFRDAGWIVRVISSTDGVTSAAVRSAQAAVVAPVDDAALGRMAGFVYGGAPVSAEDVASPAVRERLARVRAQYDPDGRFGARSAQHDVERGLQGLPAGRADLGAEPEDA